MMGAGYVLGRIIQSNNSSVWTNEETFKGKKTINETIMIHPLTN